MSDLTVIPEVGYRPLFEVIDQPADCTDHCPCNVGPSDGSTGCTGRRVTPHEQHVG